MRAIMKRDKDGQTPNIFDASWSFRDMWDAMSKMERTFSDIFGDSRPLAGKDVPGMPALDLYKDGDSYVIEAALPGVKKGEVDISATEDSLTVSGESKDERKIEEKNLYWREIRRGSFQRTLHFQEPISPEKIKAVYSDGILKITAPLQEPKKLQSVKIDIE
ncbi:MAG: Hsp20/alpha crystallin family protein [Candidatus Xenobiia bacterium LiM19]